jgi:hypothetical protein
VIDRDEITTPTNADGQQGYDRVHRPRPRHTLTFQRSRVHSAGDVVRAGHRSADHPDVVRHVPKGDNANGLPKSVGPSSSATPSRSCSLPRVPGRQTARPLARRPDLSSSPTSTTTFGRPGLHRRSWPLAPRRDVAGARGRDRRATAPDAQSIASQHKEIISLTATPGRTGCTTHQIRHPAGTEHAAAKCIVYQRPLDSSSARRR